MSGEVFLQFGLAGAAVGAVFTIVVRPLVRSAILLHEQMLTLLREAVASNQKTNEAIVVTQQQILLQLDQIAARLDKWKMP